MTKRCEADRLSFSTSVAFESEACCLAEIRRYIEGIAEKAGLDPDRSFDLKVAVSEACANAVEHGADGASCLHLHTRCVADRVDIEITDRGGFRLPPAMEGQRRAHRGLGLPLMVALVDEVRICRLTKGGTRVTLTMFLDGRSDCQDGADGC